MSKINGDKARQNLKDRKEAKRRERTRALRQGPGPAPATTHASSAKPAAAPHKA